MRPKISIIIPIYNTEQYLKRCVDSVLHQTLQDIEIILVDDGSPDNAPALCDAYAAQDARIQVIHKENEGLGFARNSGLEKATGEYVAFLDSDDYVSKSYYENLYRAAQKVGADTCISGYILRTKEGREQLHENPKAGHTFEGEDIAKVLLPDILGAQPEAENDVVMGMAVWKNLISLDLLKERKVKFCSERQFISEDALFDISYFTKAKKVTICKENGYFYCENGISLSRKYQPERFARCEVLYVEEIRRLQALLLGKEEALIHAVQRSFIGNARYCMQQIYHNLEKKEAVLQMKEICKSPLLQIVLKEYPYEKNPLKLRIFNKLIQKKQGQLLWWLIRLKG